MSRRFKAMVFWLLFVALPAQGLAAATMLFCDAAPRAIPDTSVAMMPGSHHHAASESNAATDDPAEAHGHAQNHCQGSDRGAKCAGCMAYCAGALVVPAIGLLPHLAVRDVQPALPDPVSSPGPGVDGPFRPPRSLLA